MSYQFDIRTCTAQNCSQTVLQHFMMLWSPSSGKKREEKDVSSSKAEPEHATSVLSTRAERLRMHVSCMHIQRWGWFRSLPKKHTFQSLIDLFFFIKQRKFMNAKGTSTHNTCIQQPLQTSQGMEHHLYCQWLEDWSSSGQISTKLTVLTFPMAVELCKFSNSCSNLSICNGNCSNRFHLRRLAMNFHCFNILADVMDLPCKVECVMSLYFLHWLYTL